MYEEQRLLDFLHDEDWTGISSIIKDNNDEKGENKFNKNIFQSQF